MYCLELGQSAALDFELAKRKNEFSSIEPKAKQAEKREKDMQHTFQLSDQMSKDIEGRYYWAPVLAEIIKTVPREVQITKLNGNVQGDSLKRADIQLDGVAIGQDPRRVAEDLRQTLVDLFGKKFKNVSATFKQLEDGTETVALDGKNWPSVTFGIILKMQTGVEGPATPAPVVRRRPGGAA
jgi:hypothetical protein